MHIKPHGYANEADNDIPKPAQVPHSGTKTNIWLHLKFLKYIHVNDFGIKTSKNLNSAYHIRCKIRVFKISWFP